jgi:hypothetical protein
LCPFLFAPSPGLAPFGASAIRRRCPNSVLCSIFQSHYELQGLPWMASPLDGARLRIVNAPPRSGEFVFFLARTLCAFEKCQYTINIQHGFISWVIHRQLLIRYRCSGMREGATCAPPRKMTPSPSRSIALTRRRATLHGRDDCAGVVREPDASYPPAPTDPISWPSTLKAALPIASTVAGCGIGKRRATMSTAISSMSTGRRCITRRSSRASK